jgi:hypothetical protein
MFNPGFITLIDELGEVNPLYMSREMCSKNIVSKVRKSLTGKVNLRKTNMFSCICFLSMDFSEDNDLTLSDEEKWKIQELLTFIVVGGGPTGVELAGALPDFLYNEDGMGGECMAVVQILW